MHIGVSSCTQRSQGVFFFKREAVGYKREISSSRHEISIYLFINARIVCLCSLFERLAGPFWTKVDSLDSFQRCADSDGPTF